AGDHLAGDGDHALETERLGRLEQRAGAVDHALDDSVVIAEIEEQHVTVVAFTMEPSGEPNREAGMLAPELAALVRAKTMHRFRPRRRSARPGSSLPATDPTGTPRKSRSPRPPDHRAGAPGSFASASRRPCGRARAGDRPPPRPRRAGQRSRTGTRSYRAPSGPDRSCLRGSTRPARSQSRSRRRERPDRAIGPPSGRSGRRPRWTRPPP